MRSEEDIEHAIDTHGDTVWRVCALYFRQQSDSQDAFQETILKYSLHEEEYDSEEHKKAWLIRVATNVCKDILKAAHQQNLSLDMVSDTGYFSSQSHDPEAMLQSQTILDLMQALSDPPRTPLYLSVYEGYTAPEIAEILEAPLNTVYSWIARGKKEMREVLS